MAACANAGNWTFMGPIAPVDPQRAVITPWCPAILHQVMLLRRIAASDPDERMPPDGPALAAADRDLLPDANERTRVAKLDCRRHPQRNEALRQLEEQADVMTPVPAWDAPELR